jgi:hypothetical protein
LDRLEDRCLLTVTTTQGLPVVAVEGALFSGVVAKFTSNDVPAPLSNFSSNIVWGDGTSTIGALIVVDPILPGVFDVLGNHTYAEEGSFAVTVSIHDAPPGGVASDAVAASAATVSDAALASSGIPSPPILPEGQVVAGVPTFSGTVATFTDADPAGALADYTATITWGDGVTTNGVVTGPVAGVFSVTGSHTFEEGTYPVSVAIKDTGGATTTAVTTFTITDPAPVVAPIAPAAVTATEGHAFTIPVGAFTDPNLIGTVSDFSATINWGDGTTSTGTVSQGSGGVFNVTGTHTYAEENAGGFAVTFSVKDAASTLLNAAGVTITVLDAPLNAEGIEIAAVEGSATSIPAGAVVATFTDADPLGNAADYAAVINWGNGSVGPGAIVPGTGSTFNVITAGGFTYHEEGKFNVVVTITDVGGATATAGSTATVADAPLSAVGTPQGATVITEGTPATIQVASFTDADTTNTAGDPLNTPSDYAAVIYWGDGLSSPGTIAFNGLNGFNVTGTHTYEEGTYPVRVVITDVVGGATATANTTLTVSDAALTVAATPAVTATEGQPFTAQVGAFTDANPLGTVSDFSATIDWGDATTSVGTVAQLANGTFVVTGSHTYDEDTSGGPGNQVKITVKDVGGSTLTAATGALITVNDAALSSHGSTFSAVEGAAAGTPVVIATFTDANPGSTTADFTATIDWGDGTAVEMVPAANITSTGSAAGVTFSILGSHKYVEEGTYKVIVTITDVGGAVTIAHSVASVADVAPTASATQPTVSGTEAVPFTEPVASFEEDFGTPHEEIGDYTATIDWGDGTPSSVGTISQPGGPGTAFIVTGSHTYADSGVNGGIGTFPITVTVHEDGGKSLTIANTANIADVAINLTGQLNPISDSGASNSDAITNVKQPKFFGTSEPFSNIVLFAMPPGGAPFQIGQTEAKSDGSWRISSNVSLADGSYTIIAAAVDRFGKTTTTAPVVITPNLVIDTVGPKITNVSFGRLTGQIFVTFQDERSGMNFSSLIDANNYTLTKAHTRPATFLVTAITTSGVGPTAPITVTLQINNGVVLRGGFYTFVVHTATVLNPSGIRDIAGNPLDGEFYGFFPSGNNVPGGDFIARLDAIHHLVLPPLTVIGPATPVSPPGTVPPVTIIPSGRTIPIATPILNPTITKKSAHPAGVLGHKS